MKRIVVYLLITLLLLGACEPLQIPPTEVSSQVVETEVSKALPSEPYPIETQIQADAAYPIETPAAEAGASADRQSSIPTNPPVPDLPNNITPGEMVEIPGGTFMMGCDPDNNAGSICPEAELPAHEVTLSSFLIDRYEVTNGQYKECVEAGVCKAPRSDSSRTRGDYFTNPDYELYPVINVSYNDATTYCEWKGLRLPTEAEWEYAARSSDANPFPWGNHNPDCTFANSLNNLNASPCVGDTTAVGSYPQGASAFEVLDMAGNVWEWVSDYFSADYYANSQIENPLGATIGTERVVRGGGWFNNRTFLRSSSRGYDLPFYSGSDLGFRCAVELVQN